MVQKAQDPALTLGSINKASVSEKALNLLNTVQPDYLDRIDYLKEHLFHEETIAAAQWTDAAQKDKQLREELNEILVLMKKEKWDYVRFVAES